MKKRIVITATLDTGTLGYGDEVTDETVKELLTERLSETAASYGVDGTIDSIEVLDRDTATV